MKRFITLCLIALGLIASQVSVKAQSTGPATGPTIPPPAEASFPRLDRIPTPDLASQPSRRDYVSREPKVVKKGILAPAANDIDTHQFLLSQDKTGLMRLLPRESFDWEVYKVAKQVDMRGGGAFFSFHHRSHQYGYGSDISFEKGELFVGFAGADYGILTDLGDTPLDSLFAEDPRARFLLFYEPPSKEHEARAEARKYNVYRRGVLVDGAVYGSRLPAQVNHTYLLRSIGYNRSDALVALRIVSRSEDGGLTIAWKILKEFSPTKLIQDNANN